MKTSSSGIPIIDNWIIPQQIEELKRQVLEICETPDEIKEAMRSVFRRYPKKHQLSRFMNLWGTVEGRVRRHLLDARRTAEAEKAQADKQLASIEPAPVPRSGQIDLFVMVK